MFLLFVCLCSFVLGFCGRLDADFWWDWFKPGVCVFSVYLLLDGGLGFGLLYTGFLGIFAS